MELSHARTAKPRRIVAFVGTRPECLKIASVVRAVREQKHLDCWLVNSGQHSAMVRRSLAQCQLRADSDLTPIRANISLSHAIRDLREQMQAIILDQQPAAVMVQGDTSTAYAGSLAARTTGVRLVHVEAGLRTTHPYRPFPEEMFRRRIATMAHLHFAPTALAAANLCGEGVPASQIHICGNTIIDLLREHCELRDESRARRPVLPNGCRRLITLTLHRRENYGRGLDTVCSAVLDLLDAEHDLALICPVHPNPAVGNRIRRMLSNHPRIQLTEPMNYAPFVELLKRSALIITDSGGIQEEAPYLGVPVLVVRENTERPESLACGTCHLVAVEHGAIFTAALAALSAPHPQALPFDKKAPYGDGRAGERIAAILANTLLDAQSTYSPSENLLEQHSE